MASAGVVSPSTAAKPGRSARALLAEARRLRAAAGDALEAPEERRRKARLAFEAVRNDLVHRQLAVLPVSRLKEMTEGRLRLGAIEGAGYSTVAAVLAAGRHRLEQLPGVGPQTAVQVIAAARQLQATMERSVRVRFDPDGRPTLQADLLIALRAYEDTEQAVSALRPHLSELTRRLDQVIDRSEPTASRFKILFTGRRQRSEAVLALGHLEALLQSDAVAQIGPRLTQVLTAVERSDDDPNSIWDEYERRAVAFNGLLIEVGELEPDQDATQGFVTAEVAARVNNQPLDTSLLRVSLRGYQAFGAKFALVQREAMLGDEMGLGKTVEALAAISHLHAEGHIHSLVVCPASVLVNWAHEVGKHSRLSTYRLHGSASDRRQGTAAWARRGGVAVTTFDSLRSLSRPDGLSIAMLVVDEAHYVKNPSALRTKAVRSWIADADRTLFLTGTPMENRVDEFRTLIGHLQPAIATEVSAVDGLAGASAFRQAVAPVYLRRNQSDVLGELPPRVETQDWVEFADDDLDAYREAVASGNFMAMRRAAYAPGEPTSSAKLARLVEIVEESMANGRKIVVFSFFRDVLATVATVLGDVVVGSLTGSVTPAARQALVDEFTAVGSPAVLVSQIQAGGVGLNMQAASVVILTEPQWKPSAEDQAVARCHRMGQIRPVNVHRLLAEESVDQRMLEILATKSVLFDEYVRRSELKDVSPDAVDVSDANATRQVVSQAEAERRIVEMERRRLGLEREPA